MIYKGFMSYSHAADGKLAPALQSALHRFAKPWHKIRAMRIFRDKTNLSLTPALWPNIEKALDESEFFILLASLEATASRWVGQEVEHWLKNRSAETILIVLTDGEIVWDDSLGDFDWTKTTALPRGLKNAFTTEPLYLDLRQAKKKEHLSLSHPQFRDAVAELAAPLHGRPKDEIAGEDVRQHRRTRRVMWFAIATLLLLTASSIIAAFFAIKNQKKAEYRTYQSDYRGLMGAAEAIGKRRNELSLLLLTEATSVQQTASLDDHDILRAFHDFLASTTPRIVRHGHRAPITHVEFSPDGQHFVTSSHDGTARIWPTEGLGDPIVLRGHTESISTARFDPTGQYVLTVSGDRTARLWNRDGSGQPRVFTGHTDSIMSAEFSPSGRHFLTASYDQTARIWDVSGREQPIVLRGHDRPEIYFAAFSPSGDYVVTTSRDRTARIWPSNGKGAPLVLSGHQDEVGYASFSPDGSRVATASSDKTVRIWNARTGQLLHVLQGHEGKVTSVAFSLDGQRLVTISVDGTARLWSPDLVPRELKSDGTSPPSEPIILRGHEGAVQSAVFSHDCSRVLTAGGETIRIWKVNNGEEVLVLRADGSIVGPATFSPDESKILAPTRDALVRVWRLDERAGYTVMGEKNEWANDAEFSSDGNYLVFVVGNIAQVWNLTTYGNPTVLSGHEDTIRSASFSRDGKLVVTASDDRTVRLWNLAGEMIRVLNGHKEGVRDAVFSHDGRHVASASNDWTAMIWHVASLEKPVVLKGHLDTVTSVSFSLDGHRVVTSSWDGTARVWDASNGQDLAILRGHWDNLDRAAFSPDGTRVITASRDHTARVWDLRRKPIKSIALVGHRNDVTSAVFSPDGLKILTASFDGTARLWNANGQGDPIVLRSDGSTVWFATFNSDGSRIVTKSVEAAYVWRANGQGKPIEFKMQSLMGSGAAEFSQDGAKLVTASMDGIKVWSLSTPALSEIACRVAGRNLTADEWSRYRAGEYRQTCPEWPALDNWSPTQEGIVYGEVRLPSSPTEPSSTKVTARDKNLLFPRQLTAVVTSTSGSEPLPIGAQCTFSVTAYAMPDATVLCNVQITCDNKLLYGGVKAGYFPCVFEGPHLFGVDVKTSSADGDPAISIDTFAEILTISDDSSGRWGAFDLGFKILQVRRPPRFISNVDWGCIDGELIVPNLPSEADQYIGTLLTPTEYPFTLSKIQYALGTVDDTPCCVSLAHKVEVHRLIDPNPPIQALEADTLVEVIYVPSSEEMNLRQIELPLDPPIELKRGERLFVAIELATNTEKNRALCILTCQTGGITGTDYWSNAAEKPFAWSDMVASKSIQSNVAVYGVDQTSRDVAESILDFPVYEIIEHYKPKIFVQILTEMEEQIASGTSQRELRQTAIVYAQVLANEALPQTSNEALLEFIHTAIYMLRNLRDRDLFLCLQSLYPHHFGNVDLSEEELIQTMDAVSTVLIDAYEKDNPKVNKEAAKRYLEKVLAELDADVIYLDPGIAGDLKTQESYQRACDVWIRFYELILAYDKDIAANAIRYLYTSK